MSRKTDRKTYAALDEVYSRLPRLDCRGKCAVSCGPVPMTGVEAERLRRADPGRRVLRVLPTTTSDVTCVYLTGGRRCSVYAVRPLICRVWGLVRRMSCPWGCVPERWLTDHEFVALAQLVERLGGPLVVSTPEGPAQSGDTFSTLNTSVLSVEDAEAYAKATQDLRALHGGRVIGLTPDRGDGPWKDLDK